MSPESNKPWDTFPRLQHPVVPMAASSDKAAASPKNPISPVAIVGAGLAGCWLARILAQQGIAVTLYEEKASVACGASGNPAGIAKPFVTRSPSNAMSFHCEAHRYLLDQLRQLQLESAAEFSHCGVLQLVEKTYLASDTFLSVSSQQAAQLSGVPLNSEALHFAEAGWLNPKQLCRNLVEHPLITLALNTRIIGVSKQPCRLDFHTGDSAYAEHVVLTTGSATHLVADTEHLPITVARGQISRFALCENTAAPKCVVSGKHYVIPDGQSVLVGASFHRDNTDCSIFESDHASNLAGLRQVLPSIKVDPKAIEGFAGVRATTPDRLPFVGPMPDFKTAKEAYGDIRHGRSLAEYPHLPCRKGIYIIGGLGSRGIVTAPLCAKLLADYLMPVLTTRKTPPVDINNTDKPHALQDFQSLEYWASLVNPARFLIRALKRER